MTERVLDPTLSGVDLLADEQRLAVHRIAVRMAEHDEVRFGRYELVRRLGAGGMGIVHLARDPGLDRLVALKRLHTRLGEDPRFDAFQRRLRREARAMARIDHDHVVRVHEVGEHRGCTFLAMEYVEGITLTRWLERDKRRRWDEIVRVFVAAGEGLRAVHEEGLTHCDFKPDNVLIGDGGAIKVSDFGLVHSQEARPTEPDGDSDAAIEPHSGHTTQMGQVCGTPAYMAPEQFLSLPVGHRGDQFSFCVALFGALYREPPFAGQSPKELFVNVMEGRIAEPARDYGVPIALRLVLERGLNMAPEARWPSMVELLAQLRRVLGARARLRRRAIIGAAALPVLLVLGAEGHTRLERARIIEGCEAQGEAIGQSWNGGVRDAVRQGLLATGATYAEPTADRVSPWLGRYAEQWGEHRTRVCVDEAVHGRLDEGLMQRAQWCLDTRRQTLDALVAELTVADERTVRHAVPAAVGLPSLDPCVDPVSLRALPPPPPEQAQTSIRQVHERLARAGALSAAGKYEQGLEAIEPALARTEQLGWAPLRAVALRQYAKLLMRTGSFDRSVEASADAYSTAVRARAWGTAADAANDTVFTVGRRQAHYDEARAWSRSAEAVEIFAGDPLGLRRADRLDVLGVVETAAGRYEHALALHEEANAIWQRTLGSDHPTMETGLGHLANAHEAVGNHAEAKKLYEHVLALRQASLGPEHPHVAMALNNVAVVHLALDRAEEAQSVFERVVAVRRASLGPGHVDVGSALSNLAAVHYRVGNLDEAARIYEEAVSILESALGPEHPDLAKVISNQASVALAQGDAARAQRGFEQTLAVFEAAEPEHPAIAMIVDNLAKAHRAQGNLGQARQLYGRAMDHRTRTLGPEHFEQASALQGLAEVELLEHRPAEALALAQRATRLLADAERPAAVVAMAEFIEARARWHTTPERALDDARRLSEVLRKAGAKPERAEVDAWIRDNEAASP